MKVLGYLGLVLLMAYLCACAGSPPHRTVVAETVAGCSKIYEQAANGEKVENPDDACWKSSWEHRDAYDLFFVEFDDQGWMAHAGNGPARDAQMKLLMKKLGETLRPDGKQDTQPLSLVVYTHGWHHSAAANDENVQAFRKLLSGMVVVESKLNEMRVDRIKLDKEVKGEVESTANPPWYRNRRVVGVYVGWRGDSLNGSLINWSTVWDRKLAAEKVALGSSQQLFALLHDFYLEHACKGQRLRSLRTACTDVRMLTIGHSFGGLITYRSLAPRLTMGIVEKRNSLFGGTIAPAYPYGDLTVLINPAFEGTRFESLASAGASRSYPTGDTTGPAQMPTLLVATSEGDWATGITFPWFRRLTTLFEHTEGAGEAEANIHTVGWTERYISHDLKWQKTSDYCDTNDEACLPRALIAEGKWFETMKVGNFGPILASPLVMCDGLTLTPRGATSNGDWTRPPGDPLWVIKTTKDVIEDHNDFLNIHFVDFVRQIYYTILRKEDEEMVKGLRRPTPDLISDSFLQD